MSGKKHSVRVTILNEEYTIRSETPPEHTRAVAQHLDHAIREIMSSGAVVESHRAVVLAALQVTAEMLQARESLDEMNASIKDLSEFVRPLLPPGKRQVT